MPVPGAARTTLQRSGSDRAARIRKDLAEAIRQAREDAGLSQRALARAAGISNSTLHSVEHDAEEPGIEVLARIAAALGGRLVAFIHAGTGPLVRDHHQAAMVQVLATALDARWRMTLEVAVHEPVAGVIDAVLEREDGTIVACEAHSQLRRIEQQVRWASAKADALAGSGDDAPAAPISRLLLLRSTAPNRAVVAEYQDLLRVAYPARARDTLASLTTGAPWPGASLLWCEADGSRARLLDTPPRGIRLGR